MPGHTVQFNFALNKFFHGPDGEPGHDSPLSAKDANAARRFFAAAARKFKHKGGGGRENTDTPLARAQFADAKKRLVKLLGAHLGPTGKRRSGRARAQTPVVPKIKRY